MLFLISKLLKLASKAVMVAACAFCFVWSAASIWDAILVVKDFAYSGGSLSFAVVCNAMDKLNTWNMALYMQKVTDFLIPFLYKQMMVICPDNIEAAINTNSTQLEEYLSLIGIKTSELTTIFYEFVSIALVFAAPMKLSKLLQHKIEG